MNNESTQWKKCTTCKTGIPYGGTYLTCSVSTCNTKRAAMFFCSIRCFDSHIPVMRHKEAFYQELKAPKNDAEASMLESQSKKKEQKPETDRKDQQASSRTIIVRKKSS